MGNAPFEFPEYKLAPLPPSPMVGLNPNVDKLMMLALGGNQSIAAVHAHAFNLQRELLAYAFHFYAEIDDPMQKQYIEALIRQLAVAVNQAVTASTNSSIQQIRDLMEAQASPEGYRKKAGYTNGLSIGGTGESKLEKIKRDFIAGVNGEDYTPVPRREGESIWSWMWRNL